MGPEWEFSSVYEVFFLFMDSLLATAGKAVAKKKEKEKLLVIFTIAADNDCVCMLMMKDWF